MQKILLANLLAFVAFASIGAAQNSNSKQANQTQANGDASKPTISQGAIKQVELPAEPGAWAIQIITGGGVMGNGRGNMLLTSNGALNCAPAVSLCKDRISVDALKKISELVKAAKSFNLSATNANLSGSGLCNDCYQTLLILQRREPDGAVRTYMASFDDFSQAQLPAEVKQIYAAIIALKEN